MCQNEWQILAHNISTAGAQVNGRGPNRPKMSQILAFSLPFYFLSSFFFPTSTQMALKLS